MHNYIDANLQTTASTKRLLASVKGQVWLTETAGIVRRDKKGATGPHLSLANAYRSNRFLFQRVLPLAPKRLTRIYLYEWNASGPTDSWDSALIDWTGVPRQSFYYLQRLISKHHVHTWRVHGYRADHEDPRPVGRVPRLSERELVEIVNAHLGAVGIMLSQSKSRYRASHPGDEVFFNACLFHRHGTQIWWGDLNLTGAARSSRHSLSRSATFTSRPRTRFVGRGSNKE